MSEIGAGGDGGGGAAPESDGRRRRRYPQRGLVRRHRRARRRARGTGGAHGARRAPDEQRRRLVVGQIVGERRRDPRRRGRGVLARLARALQRHELRLELRHVLEASDRILVERLQHHLLEFGRQIGAIGRDGRRLAVQDGVEDDGRRPSRERLLAGHHLVEDQAEREDVGARIERLSACLLGRHVGGGAEREALGREHHLGHRRVAVVRVGTAREQRHLGQAEVEHLHQAAAGHEDVRGLDVTVQHALRVRRVDRRGNLEREVEHGVDRHRVPADRLGERAPVEQLHGEEALPLALLDRVDRADVRVVQRRRRARLAQEALDGGRRRRQLGRQELERDDPAEAEILGLVDDTHAAGAETIDDPVMRDGLPYHACRDLNASSSPEWNVQRRRESARPVLRGDLTPTVTKTASHTFRRQRDGARCSRWL